MVKKNLTIEPAAYCRGAYVHSRARLYKDWGNRCSTGRNPTLTTLCTVWTSFPCPEKETLRLTTRCAGLKGIGRITHNGSQRPRRS